MIAYLDKYDTTVEIPDTASDKDVQDINDNFHHYIDQPEGSPQADQPAKPTQPATEGQEPATSPEPQQKWKPNFYQSVMSSLLEPAKIAGQLLDPGSPQAQAFAGKGIEEASFGLAKPLTEAPQLQELYKEHPAFADAGAITGGVGSLLTAGAALKVAGLAGGAAMAGRGAVEAGFAAGERFIPRAIMSGATFGTRTFIAETVKAFQDGGVNLEQFGKDVLKDTAFGTIFGSIGGLEKPAASISSAGALGFISSKMSGADNREATLNAAIWGAFETVGSVGKSEALRMEALGHLRDSMAEYAEARNPDLKGEPAKQAASSFLDNAMRKQGYAGAEDIAKSGPENLLEGIEKVNQMVRNARVPAEPPAEGELLPKLPAPIEPEAPKAEPEAPKPQTPIEKSLETIKGLLGFKEPEPQVKPLEVKGDTYEEKIQSLKDQGHDVSKMPESAFPEDMKDVYHFEQGKGQKAAMEKSLGEIAERFQVVGIKPNEGKAIFDLYGMDKKAALGQPSPLTDLVNKPTEEQYQEAYKAIAEQRGIDPSEKPKAEIMDHAQKAVDLINGYFSPKSQEIKAFTEQHGESSDHDIAQMAYDRGMIENPNPELLKAEIDKAKQENPIIHAQSTTGATMERPAKEKPIPRKAPPEVATNLHEYKDEITNLVTPYKAAPLAAANMREKLGLMARRMDQAEAALEDARKMFAKWTPEQVTDFYNRAELGQEQETKELDAIEESLQKPLRDLQQEINRETGRLEKPIPNYLPHAWDQGEKAIPTAIANASKRPWQGSKAFLKKRTIDTFKEGIEAGLTPTSWNPVDLVMDKIKEMSKFLAAHQTLNELKRTGLAQYTRAGADHPEGWIKINDGISDVYKSPMIAVQEAFDEKMMQDLNAVGKGLGIDLERSIKVRGKGLHKETWGTSQSSIPGQPGKIWTKFAGPESALAHELGHQIDNMYGFQKAFLQNPQMDKELTALANERAVEGSPKKFLDYIQSPPEKMAAMMEAYIHAPDLLKEKAPLTYKTLVTVLKSRPELKALTEIKPSMRLGSGESEVYAGGSVIAGHYYVQPDAARIINNYLSPGMSKSKIIKGIRFAGNLVNQFQLGFSAFHLNFTSTEAIATQIDTALTGLMKGDIRQFGEHAAKAVVAPIQTIMRGDDILKAWRGQGQSAIDEKLANILAISGGRAHMDDFYATKMVEQMRHNFQSGQWIKGILRAPLAAVDYASKPIMEYVVPRMKLGIFSEMMKMELENHPDMTHDQAREIGGHIWDTIDDRMGQVVYDNLFWNKTFKDALMLTFRSVGWNHGLVRLVVGSAKDAADILKEASTGHMPSSDKFYRLRYWLGSAITVMTLNSLYQYLKTGKGPQELKDYVFPRNGGVDSEGNPTRSIPAQNYFKDLYHMKEHPVTTIANKLSPLWAILYQALNNKDYFGTQIVNPADTDKGLEGLTNQIKDEAEFLGRAVQPFSARNMLHNLSQGNKSIESVVGPGWAILQLHTISTKRRPKSWHMT